MQRFVLFLLLLSACTTTPAVSNNQTRLESSSRLLDWEMVGYRPAEPERLAEGPSAVAVAPNGSMLILDRLNRRVLRLTTSGVRTIASVAEDAEDLAVGPDGAIAVYSPLRATVWIHDSSGEQIGRLPIPRVLRNIRGVALGSSRQVWLEDAHQERLLLGSPSAPQTLAAMLHGKREGAALLSDGTAVATLRRANGRPVLRLDKDGHTRTHQLGAPVLASRVVGTVRQVSCLRLERAAESTPNLIVAREAVCLDDEGRARLTQTLPATGVYVPRRELAVGGDPPRLTLIHPQRDGLRVFVWPLMVSR